MLQSVEHSQSRRHCPSSEWQHACIASQTRGEQHLSNAWKFSLCLVPAWHASHNRNFFLLSVSYALKLSVWLSFVRSRIHGSWKVSLISTTVMHIAGQCLYHHSPWNDSLEICCFRKIYIDVSLPLHFRWPGGICVVIWTSQSTRRFVALTQYEIIWIVRMLCMPLCTKHQDKLLHPFKVETYCYANE